MSLEKKYGLSQAQIEAMYKGGDLSCAVVRRHQIVTCYDKNLKSGMSKSKAIQYTSDEMNVSIQYIYHILKHF